MTGATKSKYIALCTPKAFEKTKNCKFPEGMEDIEIVPCVEIYMNLLDPDWTEEKCDNTVYIVSREHMESLQSHKMTFKLDEPSTDN